MEGEKENFEIQKKGLLSKIGISKFLQFRFNIWIVRFLPLCLSRAYLSFLGFAYYFMNGHEKRIIEESISAVLKDRHDPKTIRKITGSTIKGIFTHYHEKLLTAYADHNWIRTFVCQNVRLKNQEILDSALAEGRGVILITGHFGAVEFLPVILGLRKYKTAMIVRFKTSRLKQALMQRAEHHEIRLLDTQEGNVSFAALRALKENRILITECDEFDAWKPHQDKTTHLFGLRSPVDRTLDALHKKYRSPVVFGLLQRSWNGTYSLEFEKVTEAKEAGPEISVAERALGILEKYIYTYPEQWYQWKGAGLYFGLQLQNQLGQHNANYSPGYMAPANPVLAAG